jgi:integrase
VRGHLQERSRNSWRLKVYVGRSADGRKRYVERAFRGTRKEAERELARLVVDVDDGRYIASAPMTLDELLDRWLAVKRADVEPTTVGSYEWLARTYVRPALGAKRLSAIRPIDLDELYAALLARGLSRRTVRMCHTVLRQSLEQARRWGYIARNPAVDATPPGPRRRQITPPGVEDVLRLIWGARQVSEEFSTYLWVLAATGCRRGEACAVRWTDVDFDAREIHVRRSIAMHDGRPVEKDTKTHQSRRVAIDDETVALLRLHRRFALETALELGVPLPADAFVFSEAGDCSQPWRPDVCTNWFGRVRTDVGLPHVRLHDLRHFAATALGAGGTPIATISERLGHRDKATTLNIYSHSLPANDRIAASYLGDLLTSTAQRWTGTAHDA